MRRLLAVLGSDVTHSLSPLLHGAAAQALDLEVAYVPVSCPDVPAFLRAVSSLKNLLALGANVTIPYKLEALRLCDRVSARALAIGAVNTLCFSSGETLGENTDGPALVRIIESLPPDRLGRVHILGAGGVARAAAWAVGQLKLSEVFVSARRGADDIACLCGATPGPLEPVRGATLVISAVPGREEIADLAMSKWLDLSEKPAILDLAYGGLSRQSPLVRRASAAGLAAADGREMLAEQAALSLCRWTGADLAPVRSAMREAIGLAGASSWGNQQSSADSECSP